MGGDHYVLLPSRKPCKAVRERLSTVTPADLLAEYAERHREYERNRLEWLRETGKTP